MGAHLGLRPYADDQWTSVEGTHSGASACPTTTTRAAVRNGRWGFPLTLVLIWATVLDIDVAGIGLAQRGVWLRIVGTH